MSSTEFVHYHRHTLPALLVDGRSELLRGQRLPALAIAVDDEAASFTYRWDEGQLNIQPGCDQAEVFVRLASGDWQDLVGDLESIPGILYGDRVLEHRGDLMGLIRWEPALRTLYTGRPIYDPRSFVLQAADEVCLNPVTAFALDSETETMRKFLNAAGYLLVKDVFQEAELAQFRRAAEEIAEAAQEGDQQSWWGKNAEGQAVLSRCLNAGEHRTYNDPRILRLAGLLPEGMRHAPAQQKDSVTVIFKRPGMTEGLSDLPWHRDCGMGGHATMCPTFIFSIYLYDATVESGPLQFLPGSHRFAFGFADASLVDIPNAVTVPARAGDITLHVGDVMHAAPSPMAQHGPHRQSVLLVYTPDFQHHRGERHYNDVLLGEEDGQISHLQSKVGGANPG